MEWPVIVALSIGIPFVVLPAGFAWYVLAGSLYRSWKDARDRSARAGRSRFTAAARRSTVHETPASGGEGGAPWLW